MLAALALTAMLAGGGHPMDMTPVDPPVLVSFDPLEHQRTEPLNWSLPDVLPPDDSCARRGTFTSAELAECFGPWRGLIMCESSGNTEALNPNDTNGRQSKGLLQFQQQTWDFAAESFGRPDLVGVDPRTVDAATQVAMAEHHAWEMIGNLSPWPTCRWQYGK